MQVVIMTSVMSWS